MGLAAPTGFWQAMGRAGASNAPEADVVAVPKPKKKPPGRRRQPLQRRARSASRNRRHPPKPVAAPKKTRAKKPVLPGGPEPVPAPEPEALGPSPHLLDAPRGGKADDLTALKGVGAKLATSLNEFGIYHFDQLATLDDEGIDWLNEQQNGFKMLCARYDVVEQARARLA
jgi:predicted flap endonuclease-1-like 5' DNA nuclease